jgi:hypothetical protein
MPPDEEDQGPLGVVEDVEMAALERTALTMTQTRPQKMAKTKIPKSSPWSWISALTFKASPPNRLMRWPSPVACARPCSQDKGGFQWSGDIPQEGADDSRSFRGG